MREIPLKEAREQLGNLIMETKRTHEPTVITRYGKSEAVIVDFEEWQDLEAMRDAADLAIVQERMNDGQPRIPLDEVLRNLGISSEVIDNSA